MTTNKVQLIFVFWKEMDGVATLENVYFVQHRRCYLRNVTFLFLNFPNPNLTEHNKLIFCDIFHRNSHCNVKPFLFSFSRISKLFFNYLKPFIIATFQQDSCQELWKNHGSWMNESFVAFFSSFIFTVRISNGCFHRCLSVHRGGYPPPARSGWKVPHQPI